MSLRVVRTARVWVVGAILILAACTKSPEVAELDRLENAITAQYGESASAMLTSDSTLSIILLNGPSRDFPEQKLAGFSRDVARFALAKYPKRDSLSAITVGSTAGISTRRFSVFRGYTPYSW